MDEIKQYTVASIIGSYPAQYDKTRVVFTTNETGAQALSGFFKFPPVVGKTITGVYSITEKDGKTYHNFTPKAAGATQAPRPAPTNDNHFAVMRELQAINANVLRVYEAVRPDKGLTSAGTPVPFENHHGVPGLTYPVSNAKPITGDDFDFTQPPEGF